MDLQTLKELDLSDGQVAVYTACLELGVSSLNAIQEKTGIERRNIYDILNKLIEKGLISYMENKGRRTYQCTHPNRIREQVQRKQERLAQLDAQVPMLIAQFKESKTEVGAQTYRGNDAMKALLDEMLEYDESYWIGGNSGVEGTSLKAWFKHWMDRRVERKRMMYDLVDNGRFLEGLGPDTLRAHKKEFYKLCELPADLSSPMVIVIFGNKVAQILWSKQSFAFVLESPEIKESFMKYFHHFWKDPW
jgi:HTH-type transcriptional regulator, sugar sensing transcriptional regulator